MTHACFGQGMSRKLLMASSDLHANKNKNDGADFTWRE